MKPIKEPKIEDFNVIVVYQGRLYPAKSLYEWMQKQGKNEK